MDEKSLKLLSKLNPNATILTGLQTSTVIKKWGINNRCVEAGWYQRYDVDNNLDISYLPAKHWTRRFLRDTNITLWGSFMIKDTINANTLYFGADSGYGNHFAEISKLFDIDYAFLGIGAYEPEWFMKHSHTGPEDAVKAFFDLKAKKLIPMHYGTFDVSDEPIFYPEMMLRQIEKERRHDFILFQTIGQKHIFDK